MSVVFFDDRYVLDHVDFDTTRKAGWVAESLVADPVAGVELSVVSDSDVTDEMLLVHTSRYVDEVRYPTDWSRGSNWFPQGPEVFDWACAHVRGMLAAITEVVLTGANHGTLSSGFHHAKPGCGNGYCTFNGLAVAAVHAHALGFLSHTGSDTDPVVAVLDVDAHMGGGTFACVGSDPRVVLADVSTNSFDLWYPSADRHRIWFADPDTYLDRVETAARFVIDRGPSVVLYNAGMDPFDDGVPADVLMQREVLVARLLGEAGIPVAWCLAGGYTDRLTRDELVGLHRYTVTAFATGGS